MYEVEWLGPPRPEDPPEILGKDALDKASIVDAAAAALARFMAKCEQGERPYGFRLCDDAGGKLISWGAHDGDCDACAGFGRSGSGVLCPLDRRAKR